MSFLALAPGLKEQLGENAENKSPMTIIMALIPYLKNLLTGSEGNGEPNPLVAALKSLFSPG
jgi:hypothetical protein